MAIVGRTLALLMEPPGLQRTKSVFRNRSARSVDTMDRVSDVCSPMAFSSRPVGNPLVGCAFRFPIQYTPNSAMAGSALAASITKAIASAVVGLSCQSWRSPITVPAIGKPEASTGARSQIPFCLISMW